MGRLIFIGLGLSVGGITLKGLEKAAEADVLVSEEYTSMLLGGGLEWLEKRLEKNIQRLSRKQVEDMDLVLQMAKDQKVAFLVAGDSMAATTHAEIRTRARDMGIETEMVYGVSIYTAAASALGLMHYKFGRTTTLPYPVDDYLPTSPYEMICENKNRGLHTLVLLDIQAEENRYMTISEGLGVLRMLEEKSGAGLINEELLVCALARVGSEDEKVVAGTISQIEKHPMGPPLHAIIIPGNLHFAEEEALAKIRL